MKIAIFNHPFTDFYTSPDRLNCRILEYLADIIKPFKSTVFDVVKNRSERIEIPDDLKYLKEFMLKDQSTYSFFHSYCKFGDEKNFNHKYFKEFSPDVILITSFAFCYFEGFRMMTEYLKKINRNLIIICGGAGPSCYPEYYLKNSKTDYVVAGPAEPVLKKLLFNIKEKKKNRLLNVYHSGDINFLKYDYKYDFKPFIAEKKSKIVQMQLTRGCPKKCSYCSVRLTAGNIFLKSKIKKIKDKLLNLKKSENVNIDIEDDNISYDKDYLIKVLRLIKSSFKNYTLSFENGIDFTTLDEEVIRILVLNNIKQWNLSLTAINPEVLKKTGRNYNKKNFDDVIEKLMIYKKMIIVYFICGLPDDKEKNILDSLLYLAEKNVLIGISSFYPVPNTEIIKNIDIKINPQFMKGTSFYKWGRISTKKLITFFMITRFINATNKLLPIDFKSIVKKFSIRDFQRKLSDNDEIQVIIINASRDELTLIGIYLSLSLNEIIGIEKIRDNEFNLKKYDLDKKLVKDFLNKLLKIEKYSKIKL
ncbi:MAG: radical SAM protein [Spirochaetes bacterium]|nr:radical SAM protein [Spirochaetota bacterium]